MAKSKIDGTKVEDIKKKIERILQAYKIKKAGIFGSYALGQHREKSDIDILVEYDGSLLDLVRLERELKKALGKKVDLLTYGSIHPLLKKKILEEEIRII